MEGLYSLSARQGLKAVRISPHLPETIRLHLLSEKGLANRAGGLLKPQVNKVVVESVT